MKMAFLLFFLLMMLATLNAKASLPPTTLGGQQSASKPTTFNFKAPNYSATQTNGTESLIETGNKNILSNPSFEHSTFSTGWTLSATSATDSIIAIDGTSSALLVSSSATISAVQDSALYNTELDDGVQCLAQVRIKSTVALQVCPRIGSVTQTNCVTTNTDDKWALYKVPFICGATSNGISIASSGNVTGGAYIDDAFVGPQDVQGVQPLIGPWTTFTPTGSWTTNTTYTGKWRQVGENIEVNVFLTLSGTPTSATLTIDIPSQFTIDASKYANYKASDVGSSGGGYVRDSSTASQYVVSDIRVNSTSTVQPSIHNISSTGFSTSINQTQPITFASGDTLDFTFSVPVTQLSGSTSIYSSQCGANCVDTFSATISGTGVVSDENVNWIDGDCTVSPTGTYSCPFVGGLFTVSPSVQSLIYATAGSCDDVRGTNTTTTTFTYITGGAGFGTLANCRTKVVAVRQGADFTATRTIVGSFKEVVTSIGTNKPDIQSVYFGSSTNCASPCTTGTCSICNQIGNKITSVTWQATGEYNVNGIDGTKYSCSGSGNGTSFVNIIQSIGSSTTSYAKIFSGNDASQLNTYQATVHCVGRE